jgi:hypothetical protein
MDLPDNSGSLRLETVELVEKLGKTIRKKVQFSVKVSEERCSDGLKSRQITREADRINITHVLHDSFSVHFGELRRRN